MPAKKTSSARASDGKKRTTAAKAKPVATEPVATKPATAERAAAPLSPAAAYAQFLPEAEKIPLAQIAPYRLDAQLSFGNVQTAVAAIRPELGRIGRELPAIHSKDLESLPDLAAALLYAGERVAAKPVKAEVINRKLAALHALREPMLVCAEGLALLGLLPKERVARIRSGTGAFDAAQDGVALAALYREHAATLRGKQPFSDAQIAEIEALGQELMQMVTPAGAKPMPSAGQAQALAARDRLATLLEQRYDVLRRVAAYLWGDGAAGRVPLLRSRLRTGGASPAPAPLPISDPSKKDS